jgi:hypothetical protein
LTKPKNIKPMTAHEKSARVVPAQISGRDARREAVREASTVVRVNTAIDFVRSVRGR